MTTYQLSKIRQDVRAALDQNLSDDTLSDLGDIDTLTLDGIIASKVTEAVKRVHSEAPAFLLETGDNFADALYWNSDGRSGYTLLPDDFMRLVVFMMDDWDLPVYEARNADDPAYMRQVSRFPGLKGSPQRPECFISIRPEGRALEFYSCSDSDAQVSRAVYIPYPEIDEYEGVEICERCYDSAIYTTAALVAAAYGDTDKAGVLSELAKSALI